ncbi:something about silencing, SAS, complex subunit 4-domain-containing protein [Talaromyces proteolyticus]|uniref:Something about silencing, SAS, complex subunit 4-domain-containing protein n=1 Tax=Talaromyces proteolyticus TaxID=1131652 RepID=A0AAD4KHH1_9EURO|nr:something about silencing, SAS, complex subunit 4-domain-containing protein [Talaromyces proteolyticus]KAH8692254.1 something about silencing, SAS, complex subunit 4-domain-containing protein [Talaromyces proteolyticus]
MMVASSRSSLRHSVRPQQQSLKPKKSVRRDGHENQRNNAGGGDDNEDVLGINGDSRRSKPLTASKSLPNLKSRSSHHNEGNNHTKRPRRPSSPPSPSRPHRSQPVTNNYRAKHQQTTLDGFLTAKKEAGTSEENGQPPAKKARRGDSDHHHHTTVTKQPLQSRDSPDPLNVLVTPDRLRTRQRSNTYNTADSSTRSTRHTAQKPIIIANDDVSESKAEQNEAVIQEQTGRAPEKRSLRSHDGGSRSKSELAMYFPNYEQIISLEPVKQEFLGPETIIALIDDLTEPPLPKSPPSSPSRTRKQRKSNDQISPFGNPLLELYQVEKAELPQIGDSPVVVDPLSNEIYFKAHRRHERQEKQLRNIEKERAQHEKIQLDRLLDELQGHDWLRVMGISGITDTEKKLYEPKRNYFVREVSALIDKFRMWKEEEKRRKLEREQMLLEAAAAEEEEQDEEEAPDTEQSETETAAEDVQPSSSDNQSYGTPPDPNDVDAWAARQLLQEARSASGPGPAPARRRLVDALTGSPPKPQPQPQPQPKHDEKEEERSRPFVSFYPKRHLRDAAMSARRGGRNRTAFGRPLPEIDQHDFQLPSDILTEEAVDATERKRRRLKRESRG